jgi:hypothetical protein
MPSRTKNSTKKPSAAAPASKTVQDQDTNTQETSSSSCTQHKASKSRTRSKSSSPDTSVECPYCDKELSSGYLREHLDSIHRRDFLHNAHEVLKKLKISQCQACKKHFKCRTNIVVRKHPCEPTDQEHPAQKALEQGTAVSDSDNGSSSVDTPAADASEPAAEAEPHVQQVNAANGSAEEKLAIEGDQPESNHQDELATPEAFVRWACQVNSLKELPKACKSVFIQHNRLLWANELAPTQDATPSQVGKCVRAMLRICKTALLRPKRGGGRGARFRNRVRRHIKKSSQLNLADLSDDRDGSQPVRARLAAKLSSRNKSSSKTNSSSAYTLDKRSQLKKSIARAKAILRAGNSQFGNNTKRISRAVTALSRVGSLVMNAAAFEKLDELHPEPPANGPKIPDLPNEAECGPKDLGDERLVHKTLQGLASGAAAGASGWTAELLLVLWEDPKCRGALTNVIAHLANGNIDKRSGDLLRASLLLPFKKPDNKDGVRPIAMGEVLYKCVGKYLMTKHKDAVRDALPSIQLGVGADGGPEVAVHTILNALHKKYPGLDNILISDDLPNAYNERSRARMLKILFSKKKLSPLFRFAHWAYGTPSALFTVSRGKILWKRDSLEGVKQGDPIATFLFALSVQATFEEAHKIDNVTAVAVCDDLEIVGPIEDAFKAYEAVAEAQRKEGMNRVTKKRFVLWIHNREPPDRLKDLCELHDLKLIGGSYLEADDSDGDDAEPQWEGGAAKVLGCLFSANWKVTEKWVCEKVQKHLPFFRAVAHEDMPAQHAVTLLRSAGLPRMNYLTRTVPPEVVAKGATLFDELVLATLVKTCEISLQEEDDGKLTSESKRVVDQIARPTKLAGLGFRRTADAAPAAFLAAAMQARHAVRQTESAAEEENKYLIERKSAHHAVVDRLMAAIVAGMIPADKMATLSDANRGKLTEAALKQLGKSLDGLGFGLTGDAKEFCKDVDQLWTAKKMQKKILLKCELLEYRALSQHVDKDTRARLLSLSAQGSSAWTLTPAFEPSHLMTTAEYRRAIHYALNLHQLDSNTVLCPLCKKANTPQHPLNCHKSRSIARTAMHDNIEVAVTRDFRDELMWHTLRQPKATKTGNFTDLRVYMPLAAGQKNSVFEIDFVTVDPTCATHIKSAQNEGGAAAEAEQRKTRKHAPRLADTHIGFTPFGIETYGATGEGANAIMKAIARNLSEMRPDLYDLDRLQQHIRTKISVARARGLAMGLTAHLSLCRNVLDKDLHGFELREAKTEHVPSMLFNAYCLEQDNADDQDDHDYNDNELQEQDNANDSQDLLDSILMPPPQATPPSGAVAPKPPGEHMSPVDDTARTPAGNSSSSPLSSSQLTEAESDKRLSQPVQTSVSIAQLPLNLGDVTVGTSIAKEFLNEHLNLDLQNTLGDGNCGPLACLHAAHHHHLWGKSSSKNPRSAKAIRSAVAEFVEDSANDGQLALILGESQKKTRSQKSLRARASDWVKNFGDEHQDVRHAKLHVGATFMKAFTLMMGVGCRLTEVYRDPSSERTMILARDGITFYDYDVDMYEPDVILEFVHCQGKGSGHWTWAK